jgi:predicted PurR-regulated permease PerM
VSQAALPGSDSPSHGVRALSVNLTVRTMLLVAAIVGLAWAFVYIREAIMTLFLALFFALVLEPVVRLMQRHLPIGRGACATVLVLGLVALGIIFVLLLLSPLAGSFRDFVQALPGMVEDITTT